MISNYNNNPENNKRYAAAHLTKNRSAKHSSKAAGGEVENSSLVKSIRRGISNLAAIEKFEIFDMIQQQYGG